MEKDLKKEVKDNDKLFSNETSKLEKKTVISFNDDDNVLDMGTNESSVVHAPKTEKRLEEISRIANEKRKEEEEDDDFDDEFDDGPLNISDENITLDIPVKPYDTSRYSLVEMYPKTGRMHQLRIHTNKISHPLIGDSKYGDKNHDIMFKDNFGFQNLFLHAGKLEFIHPFTLDEMILIAPFPKDWNLLFEKFSWKNPLQ